MDRDYHELGGVVSFAHFSDSYLRKIRYYLPSLYRH